MSYSGQYIEISDATQEALDLKADITYVDSQDALKASLADNNIFTGNYNRFESNVLIPFDNHIQAKKIYGYSNIEIESIGNTDIALIPHGTGVVTSTKDINLSAGANYKINNVNIPTLADLTTKADLAGGNTFTGDQVVDNIIIGGDIKGVQDQDLQIQSNSGGTTLTAMTIKSNAAAEMEGKTTFKQAIIGGVSQSLTAGSPVIDSVRLITKLDTTGGNITATISNGTADGQIKILNLHKADTQYTATLSVNVSEAITLKNVGEGCLLAWSGNTADWSVVSKNQNYLTELLSVNDIEVRGAIKGVQDQDLQIQSNSGGTQLTAMKIKSNGTAEMEGKTTFKQAIIGGVSQSLTAGSPVIDSVRLITKLDTTGGNITATISNGTADGQLKILNLHKADTQYSATLSVNVSEAITLKNVGEGCLLAWSGNTADWSVVSKNQNYLTELLSVNDIEVRGAIKGVQDQDLTIESNSGGTTLTAMKVKSNGTTEMEGKTTFKQAIIGGVSQSLTAGSPVIDSVRLITKLDTRAGNITATISNGTADGQIKILNLHRADTQYTATLSVNVSEAIVLRNVGEGCVLAWSGNTADWSVVSKNSANLAYANVPLGTATSNKEPPASAVSGDIYRDNVNGLFIKP